MTMVETLLTVALAALVALPMLGWAEFAMREQVGVQVRNDRASQLGILRTHFLRDVGAAERARLVDDDAERCPGTPGTGQALVLERGELRTTYSTAPGSTGTGSTGSGSAGTSLWRTECDPSEPGDLGSTEVATDLDPTGVSLLCGDAQGSPAGEEGCHIVRLRLTGDATRLSITATPRSLARADEDDGPSAAPPQVALSASPAKGPRSLSVQFSSAGSGAPDGTPVELRWDFGDGATSSDAAPMHAYHSPGSYTASLTVRAAELPPVTDFVVVEVLENAPVARIAAPADGTTVHRGQPVAFSSAGSGDPLDAARGGRIVSYRWDFGDGTTSNAANPTKAFDDLSPAGGFPVRLTVTDDGGAVHQAQVAVVVANRTPTVTISADPATGDAPLTVQLSAQVTDETSMPQNPPLTYLWDFGDGRTATGASTSVTYQTPGVRTVTVVVVDDAGATGTGTRSVTVEEPPGDPRLESTITGTRSNFNWYNGTPSNGNGQWVGYATFRNDWIRQQYLDVRVVKVWSNGTTTTQQVNGFYVPAGGTSELAVWNNDMTVSGGTPNGVVELIVTVTDVRTSDENWKQVSGPTNGPTATIRWPS